MSHATDRRSSNRDCGLIRSEGLQKGADGGPVAIPGRPEESALIKAIRHEAAIKMPPRSKLSDQAIADLTTWVEIGAPWPDNTVGNTTGRAGGLSTTIGMAAKSHWAFQKIKDFSPPAVKNHAWPQTTVDRFILAASKHAACHRRRKPTDGH